MFKRFLAFIIIFITIFIVISGSFIASVFICGIFGNQFKNDVFDLPYGLYAVLSLVFSILSYIYLLRKGETEDE